MVQSEINPVVVLSQSDQTHAKQRRDAGIKTPANVFRGDSNSFRFTVLGWKMAEIVEWQMHANIRFNPLNQFPLVQKKGGPPDLVPPHNLVEAALQDHWIERPPFVDGHSFVVGRHSGC